MSAARTAAAARPSLHVPVPQSGLEGPVLGPRTRPPAPAPAPAPRAGAFVPYDGNSADDESSGSSDEVVLKAYGLRPPTRKRPARTGTGAAADKVRADQRLRVQQAAQQAEADLAEGAGGVNWVQCEYPHCSRWCVVAGADSCGHLPEAGWYCNVGCMRRHKAGLRASAGRGQALWQDQVHRKRRRGVGVPCHYRAPLTRRMMDVGRPKVKRLQNCSDCLRPQIPPADHATQ